MSPTSSTHEASAQLADDVVRVVEPDPLVPVLAVEAESIGSWLALLIPPVVGRLGLIPELAGPELPHGERGRVAQVGASCAQDFVAPSSNSRVW